MAKFKVPEFKEDGTVDWVELSDDENGAMKELVASQIADNLPDEEEEADAS